MKKIVLICFILIAIVGIKAFSDYGMSFDDPNNQAFGDKSFEQYINIFHGNVTHLSKYYMKEHNVIHGPAYEMFITAVQQTLKLTDSRDIYLTRHFLVFVLFFISLIFLYKIGSKRFSNPLMGLLGVLLLFLSPRIFADSFYNSVDIGALSVMIISSYTLLEYIDKKTWKRLILHASVCGVAMTVRTSELFIIASTFLFILIDSYKLGYTKIKETIWYVTVYSAIIAVLIFILTPYSWGGVSNYINSLLSTATFTTLIPSRYFGQTIWSDNLPWHFNIVWIVITTPLFYSLLFLIGLYAINSRLIKNRKKIFDYYFEMLILIWFFIPLVAIMILHTSLYNGWRHTFFVYPAFILIAIEGIWYVLHLVKNKKPKWKYIIVAITIISLMWTAGEMWLLHPYEYTYFNILVPRTNNICGEFDKDYWSISYKQGMEWILKNDPAKDIHITSYTHRLNTDILILPKSDRARINATTSWQSSYYLTNYFIGEDGSAACDTHAGMTPEHTLSAQGISILSIIKQSTTTKQKR